MMRSEKPVAATTMDAGQDAADAMPCCFVLAIVGGMIPAMLTGGAMLPSLVGVVVGTLLGVIVAYYDAGRASASTTTSASVA